MSKGRELSALRRAIIENTKGDLFWLGEILLAELEKETGFKGSWCDKANEPCYLPECAAHGCMGRDQ